MAVIKNINSHNGTVCTALLSHCEKNILAPTLAKIHRVAPYIFIALASLLAMYITTTLLTVTLKLFLLFGIGVTMCALAKNIKAKTEPSAMTPEERFRTLRSGTLAQFASLNLSTLPQNTQIEPHLLERLRTLQIRYQQHREHFQQERLRLDLKYPQRTYRFAEQAIRPTQPASPQVATKQQRDYHRERTLVEGQQEAGLRIFTRTLREIQTLL